MAQSDITVIGYFPRIGTAEDQEALTYWDSIKPTLMSAEEYFSTVESKEDWQKRHEGKALSEHYGVPVKVEIRGAA